MSICIWLDFWLRIEEDISEPQNLDSAAVKISEFHSSFSQLCVCRHIWIIKGLQLAAWIDLLFIKNEFLCIDGSRLPLLIILQFIKQKKQVIAVKTVFWKILKRKYIHMKNL